MASVSRRATNTSGKKLCAMTDTNRAMIGIKSTVPYASVHGVF